MGRFACLLRLAALLALFGIGLALDPARRISEDRELKEIELSNWDCRDSPEGTAKTPDGRERNRLKNRSAPSLLPTFSVRSLDMVAFLQHVAAFEALTKNMRRKDLSAVARQQLGPLEKEMVSFDGYLVLAYAGPPETTNCASVDFHDWHLEVFDHPLEHAPQVGDPTPIICEITPRTQNAIYRENIRLQALAGFIRAPDLTIEPTGHPARKIRVTGYLLWDDEHNGRADVGSTIGTVAANGFHQPWRATAWEIHPVIKMEALEGATVPAATTPPVSPVPATTPNPIAAPSGTPALPQSVILTRPVRMKIPYGEVVLQPGTKLPIVSHDATTVTVRYLGTTSAIPIASTDLH